MDQLREEQIVNDIRRYISENIPLSQMSDEDLERKIEDIATQKIGDAYISISQRVSIVQQVYSSIRGFGLLDSILKDETITEVMINGPDNIFIEQNGRLTKLDKKFDSQKRLEDIIQRIVGMAGREVNQANPICDTRLPDGSRVNVVLPPVALCGPTITIRKFSKEPMTMERLIRYKSLTPEIAEKLEVQDKAFQAVNQATEDLFKAFNAADPTGKDITVAEMSDEAKDQAAQSFLKMNGMNRGIMAGERVYYPAESSEAKSFEVKDKDTFLIRFEIKYDAGSAKNLAHTIEAEVAYKSDNAIEINSIDFS